MYLCVMSAMFPYNNGVRARANLIQDGSHCYIVATSFCTRIMPVDEATHRRPVIIVFEASREIRSDCDSIYYLLYY